MATIDGGAPMTEAKRGGGDVPLSSSCQTLPKKPKIVLAEDEKKPEMDHVDEEDSDTEFDPVIFTDEQLQRYDQQVKESGGYDVDYLPGSVKMGMITPVRPPDLNAKIYSVIAKEGLRNMVKDGNKDGAIEFIHMVKLMVQPGGYSYLYMTFEAKDTDGKVKIFRSKMTIGETPHAKVLELTPISKDDSESHNKYQ